MMESWGWVCDGGDSLRHGIERGAVKARSQQRAELETEKRFTRILFTLNKVEITGRSDQDGSGTSVNRQDKPSVKVLKLTNNLGQLLVQLTASNNSDWRALWLFRH